MEPFTAEGQPFNVVLIKKKKQKERIKRTEKSQFRKLNRRDEEEMSRY